MIDKNIIMEQLVNAGAHFGHKTSCWNPNMKPYIYTKHNGIHIINLEHTLAKFNLAISKLKSILNSKGKILFVGTKKVVSDLIAETAVKFKQYYINTRWLGGTLTNWGQFKKLIEELKLLEVNFIKGNFTKLNKKEELYNINKMKKLQRFLNGIKEMQNLPTALFFIDANKEQLAIQEAHKLNIPIYGIVDTDSNPGNIDIVIPGNDDSYKAIKLYLNVLEEQLM